MAPKYPFLLIFKEKHNNQYFHITSREDHVAALTIMFRARDKQGYWYHYPESEPLQAPLDIPDNLNIDVKVAYLDINKGREKFNRQQKQLDYDRTLYLRAKNGDELAIIDFMHERKDHQYEEFDEEYYSVF